MMRATDKLFLDAAINAWQRKLQALPDITPRVAIRDRCSILNRSSGSASITLADENGAFARAEVSVGADGKAVLSGPYAIPSYNTHAAANT